MPFQICDVRWLTTLSPGATDPSESCNKGAVILIYKKPELNNSMGVLVFWRLGSRYGFRLHTMLPSVIQPVS